MKDPRLTKLAHMLVDFSCKVKPGERVLVNNVNAETAFVREIVDAIYEAGGLPFVELQDREVERSIVMHCTEEQLALRAQWELARMQEMDCYIGFTSLRNLSAWGDIPEDKISIYNKFLFDTVHIKERVPNTRWVVLRYPSPAMAQCAEMSESAFEDFYFDVCTMNYPAMSRAMDPLVELMARTDRVRIVSPGTDLSFSIKGLPPVKCDGDRNIPDGEVYTAPVRDSVNGVISYNTPSLKDGFVYENIRFEFKNGKIVNASANDTKRINQVLDTDEGSRYVGEFALGVNPFITKAMKETLFDEKISGSFHFTPGNAYSTCDNGNHSAIHWDLVQIQTPEMGGGEIWFDDVLIRKDGLFVLPGLTGLNPQNLKLV